MAKPAATTTAYQDWCTALRRMTGPLQDGLAEARKMCKWLALVLQGLSTKSWDESRLFDFCWCVAILCRSSVVKVGL